MNIQAKFNNIFGFTPAERRVVLILFFTFIAGITIKIARSAFGEHPTYDYASMDSAFYALSSANVPDKPAVPDTSGKPLSKYVKKSVSVINLNTATKSQLVGLPGVGETLAGRIISYREAHGRFKSVRELLFVEGIGEKKFTKIASFVTIGTEHE
jgi:competence ComEA-like helix-hairpin-helix protein